METSSLFSVNPTPFETGRKSEICLICCSHTRDLSFPFLLLEAVLLQVGQGAGIPAPEHGEAADTPRGGRELLGGDGGAADRAAHRAAGHVAGHGQSLDKGDTGR